jgi:hypothetical protein
MLKKLVKILNAKDVRRYNFIVGTRLLYQGVFTQYHILGWFWVKPQLINKKYELAYKYMIHPKDICISITIKD